MTGPPSSLKPNGTPYGGYSKNSRRTLLCYPPTGSAVSALPGAHGGPDGDTLTVGEERRRNPVARLGLPAFVESLLHQGLPIPAVLPVHGPA